MTVKQLQLEIGALSESDFARLRQWFVGRDLERWDRQLESYATVGKLNSLLEEAAAAGTVSSARSVDASHKSAVLKSF